MTTRVLVLAGGLSHERDVSLRSGRRVAEALRDAGLEVDERDVDASLLPWLREHPPTASTRCCTARPARTARCARSSSWSGVPYVGAGPAASRVAFDKPVAKVVAARAGCTPRRR